MNYWLIKSEPGNWSFEQHMKKGIEPWDGVRNYQARNFLKQMNIGDLCFFYHSVKEKRIVGIVKVVSEYYLDPTDDTHQFGLREMKYVKQLQKPVSLDDIKNCSELQDMILLKQSRLSVQPLTAFQWNTIMTMSNTVL